MVNSQKIFNKMTIDTTKLKTLDQFWRLRTLFYKFGSTVTELIWESCRLTKTEIILLLNYLPNLENLIASTWKMQQVLFDDFTNLELIKLRKLKIKRSDQLTVQFFSDHLPKHILREIVLQGEPDNIFSSQITLKKVDLNVDSFNSTFNGDEFIENRFTHLKLKMRKYRDDLGQSIINKILQQQPSLIQLDLVECEGCFDEDDGSFIEICNLRDLQILKINIDSLSPAIFARYFHQLNHLTDIHLESVEHNFTPVTAIVESLSRHDMEKLESLRVDFNDFGIDKTEIERMGVKFKNLKTLWIRCDHPLPADVYLANFNNLTSLYIDYHYSKEFANFCDSFDIKFNNINEVSLHGFSFGSEDVFRNELTLLKFTEIVPNLKILECDANFPFNTEYIFRIMEKLNKLEVIKNWSMTQSGENYISFDGQSILDLKGIAGMLKKFSIELKLRAFEMDLTKVKNLLEEKFDTQISRVGNYFVIRMEKNHL